MGHLVETIRSRYRTDLYRFKEDVKTRVARQFRLLTNTSSVAWASVATHGQFYLRRGRPNMDRPLCLPRSSSRLELDQLFAAANASA
jgi:hypothetical protein